MLKTYTRKYYLGIYQSTALKMNAENVFNKFIFLTVTRRRTKRKMENGEEDEDEEEEVDDEKDSQTGKHIHKLNDISC